MLETNVKIKTDLKTRSYKFAVNLVKFIDTLDKKDFNIQILVRQLLRSGTSIGANIIEAVAASSRKDFINFYLHALKSANETIFWLNLFADTGKSEPEIIKPLLSEAQELANILGASVISLKKSS
jgi:four helix bundle protein